MKSILVTGGTGSFGKQFISKILSDYPEVERLIVLSRDELKQFEMAQTFPREKYPQLRYFLGDVRDKERLRRAFDGIEIIVHAAALKQVPAAEYNPMEFIKTNVLGAQNIIEASIDAGVKKVIALSTDKACAPVNLYGASKLCSDKLFVAANNYAGLDLRFSVVRYGNVMGSRGSVIPFFLERRDSGTLPITHDEMTRFNITLSEGVDMVIEAISDCRGGEIFVPRIPSYKILDLAEAICPRAEKPVVGIRPGEKIHEEMISESDSDFTIETKKGFVILPAGDPGLRDSYIETDGAKSVAPGFKYNSGTNSDWLSVDELRELIAKHVDPSFEVRL